MTDLQSSRVTAMNIAGIGEICMQNPPVNGLHSGMLEGLTDSVKSLEKDGCRAFLLTSVGSVEIAEWIGIRDQNL